MDSGQRPRRVILLTGLSSSQMGQSSTWKTWIYQEPTSFTHLAFLIANVDLLNGKKFLCRLLHEYLETMVLLPLFRIPIGIDSLSSSPSAPYSCIWIRQRRGDLEATGRKRSAARCRSPWTRPPPRCQCWPATPGNKLYVLCVQVHLQPSLQIFKGCYARGESQVLPEK